MIFSDSGYKLFFFYPNFPNKMHTNSFVDLMSFVYYSSYTVHKAKIG